MALPVEVACIPPGSPPRPLTALLDGQPRFATAAVGGFADCSFTLRGDQRRLLPYLSLVRITLGPTVLFEGQIEDADPSGSGSDFRTSVTCFGLRRLLTENSVRRIWSKRDIPWIVYPGAVGANVGNSFPISDMDMAIGQYDSTDLTKQGIRAQGKGVAVATGTAKYALYTLPSGLTFVRIMGTLTLTGGNTGLNKLVGSIIYSSAGTNGSWTGTTALTASGAFNNALGGNYLAAGAYNSAGGSLTPTTADTVDLSDLRILCTAVTEDASGGFYGGTILRDLIALVPGLTPGLIEDGSDFTIQALERAVRDTCQSVIEEVSGYYTREWAVWEDGRFDWKTRPLDQPDWIVTVADCDQLAIGATLDGITRTVYVLYTDAASGLDAEASAAATAQRNPYVKQSRTKDLNVSPGFPMTANTSAALASRIVGDVGQWVPAAGTITLPATKIVNRTDGPGAPAMTIRGGDNILIPDLPKTDLFQQGRDGETLFHVASADCDLAAGTVVLQLEGQSKSTDAILARLAAVTRILTG